MYESRQGCRDQTPSLASFLMRCKFGAGRRKQEPLNGGEAVDSNREVTGASNEYAGG